MKTPAKLAIVTVVVVAALVALMKDETSSAIEFYCAAGMKKPMTEIIAAYEKEHPGRKIEVAYGGSGTLLTKIKAQRDGDLYLAADISFIDLARKDGLAAESIPVAKIRPVIVVKEGNPKKIATVDDLMREDVRVALGNPEAASVGKTTRKLMVKLNRWEELQKAIQARGVYKPTVNEIANDVKIDAADAAIVWDSIAEQYPELESVDIEGARKQTVTICVLNSTSTKIPASALHFARYVCSRDRGLDVFGKHGFERVEGDAWESEPKIMYFAGGLNKHAARPLIVDFEKREGCKVDTVWMGCGMLVDKMKNGETPDVYHTCDASFHAMVEDKFGELVNISQTDIIILVQKGNPKDIKTLQDLTRPGVRVGLANEEQTALGKLSAVLLKDEGVYDQVISNREGVFPEAPMVVGQVTQGALDAGLVYVANAHAQRSKVELIKIDNPLSRATQTYAISKASRHKHLMRRLLEHLRTKSGQVSFENAGFEVMTQPESDNE